MNDLEIVYLAARELPVERRTAFLEQACEGDAGKMARVKQMLSQVEAADAFFDQPTDADRGFATVRPGGVAVAQVEEAVGQTLGRYKLLEQVGEGGCGVVYVAEQTEPVRRRVALKVIKLGMDTRQVVARFEAERQALAMMDHPNIAKVLDAGTTETGRPYFVMELVRGIRITDYCDQANLHTGERLDLFIKVCQAVQHAHQKGIIHRDIKPSNILVTLHDGVPVPKVIDFGIAKATEGRLTDNTVYTQLHQFIGTPAYMSPEQAEMSGLDIDTRSDIYSLGVLLYELLAGSTPFDAKQLMSQGIDAMRRTIREIEPVRPSTRLARLEADEQTTTAKRRSVDTNKLVRQLQGDLDWIVMKCLEKDRGRRYDTANGLAADLKRHLGNEPVLARPPSRLYEFQKTVRRHKFGFAAATALMVVLAAGVLTSTWQAVLATRAQAESDQARQDAEAISSFLTGMFERSRPGAQKGGREVKVAEILDDAAANLATNLTAQPSQRARLQATLGETYLRLGLAQEALLLLEVARDYYQKSLGPEHPETLKAAKSLAESYDDAGRRDDALQLREATLELSRKALGPEHPETLRAMHQLTRSYLSLNRTDDALRLEERLLPLAQKVLGPDDDTVLAVMNALGAVYAEMGRLDESIRLLEKALPLVRKAKGGEHPYTIVVMASLSGAYAAADRLEEALSLREEVLSLSRKVNGDTHFNTLNAMGQLSSIYWDLGRWDAAVRLREQMRVLAPKAVGSEEHPLALQVTLALGEAYREVGRLDEAIRILEGLPALAGKVLGAEDRLALGSMVVLADCYHAAGRQEEALRLRDEAVRSFVKVRGPEHRDTAIATLGLAESYDAGGRRKEALRLREEAVAILRQAKGPEDHETVQALTQLAISLQAADRGGEAVALDEPALRLLRKKFPGQYRSRIQALETLILCYDQSGRQVEAEALRKERTDLRATLARFKPASKP